MLKKKIFFLQNVEKKILILKFFFEFLIFQSNFKT